MLSFTRRCSWRIRGSHTAGIPANNVGQAVKEFSKSRLRKRAQSNILRRPHGAARRPGHLAAGLGFNSPLHRHSSSEIQDHESGSNPLYLIKEEIAIMKKLNHNNLVSLIEVLDDPNEDSLYMVLEMCKKGVIMKVGVDERADPYDEESCRCWFRDLILGIEYLHAQGVVHRDIKPDNLLLTEDDVLKIVDFGVSEMFEKDTEMLTVKSAGSPAFLPPELCVAKHGGISGKAADIWSMGVTLYCLRFGHIPFEREGVLDLYQAIKEELLECNKDHCSQGLQDLLQKLLDKDPTTRIKMSEIRVRNPTAIVKPKLLTLCKGPSLGDQERYRSSPLGRGEYCQPSRAANRGGDKSGHYWQFRQYACLSRWKSSCLLREVLTLPTDESSEEIQKGHCLEATGPPRWNTWPRCAIRTASFINGRTRSSSPQDPLRRHR